MKTLALVAHDNRKPDLIDWVKDNYEILIQHNLVCTGTTGKMVLATLREQTGKDYELFKKLKSGPLGGDQQLGAMVAQEEIDTIIFFWDPMEPHPHDVDVKALLRMAVVYNIPMACNRSTADFIVSSPLINDYERQVKDYSDYLEREVS